MGKAIPCCDHKGNQFSSMSQMCDYYNINYYVFKYRIESGFSLEKSLTSKRIIKESEFNVGDERYNFQGLKMKIIKKYDSGSLIDVAFDDGYVRQKAHMSEFKNGTIRNHMVPAIYGVGILGDVKTKVNGKFTKEYSTWSNILQRCYDKEKQEEFPRYKGCLVCDEWLYFPNFIDWCHSQSNWGKVIQDRNKFHIDKDILVKGNKVYGPETCCFVPNIINGLFTKNNAKRGLLPIGVSEEYGKLRSRCNNPYGKDYYKYGFTTPEEAFIFYKQCKQKVISQAAQIEFEKGNITQRCYEAMLNYKVEIDD